MLKVALFLHIFPLRICPSPPRLREHVQVGTTIRIEHTVVRCKTLVKDDKTKNTSSFRSFPLLKEIKDILLSLQMEQKIQKKMLGSGYIDSDYIFRWADGHLFSPGFVSDHFKLVLKKSAMRPIRFHDLRHSCASILIANGYTLKDIADWLGHSNIKVTADTYGHLELARKKNMGSELSGMLNIKATVTA